MSAYLKSHMMYVAIIGTLMVAMLFVLKESWLSRQSKRAQGRIQASIRGLLICAACFLGIYYGAQFAGSTDFPVGKVWPLTTVVAIIVYMSTFYALWTLFMLKPEDGLLFKGSVYKLLEMNAMKDMTDMEYEFTKMTMLMLTKSRCQNYFVRRSEYCKLHPNGPEFEQVYRDPAFYLWINVVTDENGRMNAVDKIR